MEDISPDNARDSGKVAIAAAQIAILVVAIGGAVSVTEYLSLCEAMDKGVITAEFPRYQCANCGKQTVLSVCEMCDKPATRL